MVFFGGSVGKRIHNAAAAGAVFFCAFGASGAGADVEVIVQTQERHGHGPTLVFSNVLSIADGCEVPLCPDGCFTVSLERACGEEERLRAEPLDSGWYYHSREECCQEPLTVLEIKRKKYASTPRAGFMNPAVLDLSFEYRFWCDLGLEVAAVLAEGRDASRTPRQIWAVALNIHPVPRGRLDVYFGPMVGYLAYDDVVLASVPGGPRPSVAVDNDVALGFNFGVSIPFPRRSYGLNLGLRYFRASPSASAAFELDENLTVVSAGLTWRF